MQSREFINILKDLGGEFFTGVPDSLLAPFINTIYSEHGISEKHIVAANEGAAVGLAAGHYLATGKPAVVYMQNSGLGNAVNPICSLLHQKVYAIPAIFVVGWRGEPGIKDEPQHVFQGEITVETLDLLEIPYIILPDVQNLNDSIAKFKNHLKNGQSVAFVIRKGALESDVKPNYSSNKNLSREEALKCIINAVGDDCKPVFVCTTGKLSREIFEIRETNNQGHHQDFLTVGSMGHSLAIAHGISASKPAHKVFCLDGDGAALMHMGSLAVTAAHAPKNLVHIVINNAAHETVGGLPTVGGSLNLQEIAKSMGYSHAFCVDDVANLKKVIMGLGELNGPIFVEVLTNLNSRKDLGRPTTTPIENKLDLMKYLKGDL